MGVGWTAIMFGRFVDFRFNQRGSGMRHLGIKQTARGVMDPKVRQAAEWSYGQDFREVRLRIQCGTALAWADGVEIVASDRLPAGGGLRQAVLLHELAHVAQRRNAADLACPSGTAQALEHEAGAAAAAALLGQRFRPRLADRGGGPRAYSEAGHYYTVYYLLLAAGAQTSDAAEMAFYCQMPDQVIEFDALNAGYDYLARVADNTPGDYLKMDDRIVPGASFERDIDIEKGLHCLTGGQSAPETSYRAANLIKLGIGTIGFGIGLHSYGDSFAHRQINNDVLMYEAPIGHGVEIIPTWLGFSNDGHAPDEIWLRPDLYVKYGLSLYDVLCQALPSSVRRVPRSDITGKLMAVAKTNNEKDQITQLRQFGSALGCPFNPGYAPETTGMRHWPVFCQTYCERSDIFDQTMMYAALWTSERRPGADFQT
jgi:hypothetical protein